MYAPWITTERGAYMVDWTGQRIYHSGITFSDGDPDNGKALVSWDNALWFAKAANIRQVTQEAQIGRGPNQGDGLLAEDQGTIVDMDTGFDNFLVYAMNGQGVSTQYSHLMAYNKKGHHVLARTAVGTSMTFCHSVASSAVATPGVVLFNEGTALKYIKLFDTTDNPYQFRNPEYELTGELIKPWFDGGLAEVEKVAHSFQIRTSNCNSTDKVTVYYSLNEGSTWTQFYNANGLAEEITTNGAHVLYYDDRRHGTKFYSMHIKTVLESGSDASSPKVLFEKIRYLRELPTLYAYDFRLNLDGVQPDGRTASQAIQDLDRAVESRLLGDFAYHSGRATDSKIVVILNYSGPTGSATDRGGFATLSVVELTNSSENANSTQEPQSEEVLTVTNSLVVTLSASELVGGGTALITSETAPVRYFVDGSEPTPSSGHILPPGYMLLLNATEAANFKTIASTSTDGRLVVTY
jgi:hypothetical protein